MNHTKTKALSRLFTKRQILLHYRCRDIGYGVEENEVCGQFTGEEDSWGKYTFVTLEGQTLYLFDDEILAVTVTAR